MEKLLVLAMAVKVISRFAVKAKLKPTTRVGIRALQSRS